MVQMRKWNDVDEGSGLVPRSSVPLEYRIATMKSLLEAARLSYVKKSLSLIGKSTAHGVDENDNADKRLVSLHSMRHVMNGTMSIQNLYDRKSKPMFCLYTSKHMSEINLKNVIIRTKVALK